MNNNILILAIGLLMSSTIFGQIPQALNYQAVARNSSGQALMNGNISIRASILDGSATGTVVYTETHSVTTNAMGLFTLNIGNGAPSVFSGIDWSYGGSKWLEIEMDPTGGSNYVLVGSSQILSTPYAFVASKIDNAQQTFVGTYILDGTPNNSAIYTIAPSTDNTKIVISWTQLYVDVTTSLEYWILYATIIGNTFIIPSQTLTSAGFPSTAISGSGTLVGNKITMTLNYSSGGSDTWTIVKQ